MGESAQSAPHTSAEQRQRGRWMRLGQLVDSTPELDFTALAEVLAGERSYDDLGEAEGELVLAVWQRRIDQLVDGRDMRPELKRRGKPWYEADAEGNIVERNPGDRADLPRASD